MFVNSILEIDHCILSFLHNPQDFCRASQVNKAWLKYFTKNEIWQPYLPYKNIGKIHVLKELFNDKAVISMNQIIDRINTFSLKIHPKKNAEFNCYFPEEMYSHFSVRIINDCESKKKIFRENCWFVKTQPYYSRPKKYRMAFTENNTFFVSIRLPEELTHKDTHDKILDNLENNIPMQNKPTKPKRLFRIPYGIFRWIPGFKKSEDN
jgi:hypothetical protein